jgi:hypothetical protein
MLQPRTYPELIGKTLVLEAEPFVVMTEDDNPWVEGLFLTASLGFVIGVAQLIGGLLLTASLPRADAMLEAILQGWRQFSPNLGAGVDPTVTANNLRQVWSIVTALNGYGGGWFRLFTVVATPFLLVLQWLIAGLIVFLVARALGGRGTLNQTLGSTALMVAPHALSLLAFIPFVSVSRLLLITWSVLIIYRATEVTHQLPWQRAVWVALAPIGFLVLIAIVVSVVISLGVSLFLGGPA